MPDTNPMSPWSPPTALDILRRARELPWTRGAYARAADGSPVFYGSVTAVRFCLAGACRRAAVELGAPRSLNVCEAEEALVLALPPDWKGYRSLEEYNDARDRTEAEVRAVEDLAIARQEAQRA